MAKLAINGGKPIRTKLFPAYVTVGEEEKIATARVIDSGILSRYIGAWHEQFYGGTEVQALEKEWGIHYNIKHAIAVNSASSGLICALGAIGLEPGDEVIVTPWSMSISATAPLFYGAIPVFADIEPDCFCLDVKSIEKCISSRTRAIIVVDLFGQPYNAKEINALAKKHNISVIEDCAQAPGSTYLGKPAGTLADIGIYSLNYHKHIHCGEGGIIVTNDSNLAERLQLIRNHAEAVVEGKGVTNLCNMLGQNYRMTELEAAVARCQLKKLEKLNLQRLENVKYLENKLSQIPFLTMPRTRSEATHVYYAHACLYNEKITNIPIRSFAQAIKAELPTFKLREKEGTKLGAGYVKPLYLLPIFQERLVQGTKGFPFTLACENVSYRNGLCPVCEELYTSKLFTHEFMLPSMCESDLDDVINAFTKVTENINELREVKNV